MPSLDINFLHKLKEDFTNYPIFIETGTYNGETIFNLELYFNKLFTIELSEFFYNNTKNKYNNNKINFIHGDSSKILSELLKEIVEPCIFFLDGHFSSWGTAKGDKDVPLYEEIISIRDNCKSNALIIIDDCRLFGTKGPEDWSDINTDKILFILSDRINEYYFLDSELSRNDRLIISIKNKQN